MQKEVIAVDHGSCNYRRFLDGDENGLVAIIHDYKDGLILYLNSIVNNLHAAEELAEDTFVKLGVKKPRDNGKGAFKTWLYTMGRHLAIDYLRRQRKIEVLSLESEMTAEEYSLESAFLHDERNKILHQAMRRLKPEYGQVLWLVYFEGFSLRQVAKVMNKSVHATETLVYRARLSLKTVLTKEGFDDEKL